MSYPVTAFRDTGAQQSMCTNVIEKAVNTGKYVTCRGFNTEGSYQAEEVELVCQIVMASA